VDLKLNPRERRFKEMITLFIDTHFPSIVRESPTPADRDRWHKSVAAKGWTAPEWASKFGGTGWSTTESYLWYSLTTDAGCPQPDSCAIQIVGPLLHLYGNDPSHIDHVDNILNRSVIWGSALFPTGSEISASKSGTGFKLDGSLRCLIVDGYADQLLVLATTPEGYSLFIVNPTLSGVQLTPNAFPGPALTLKIQNVQIPDSCLIGHLNMGLEHLTHLLCEKQSVSTALNLKPAIYNLKKIVCELEIEGEFEHRLAEYDIEFEALRVTALRILNNSNQQNLQIVNSRVEKLKKKINESITNALGYYAIPLEPMTPGENEPAVSPVSLKLMQLDPFESCPEGFREDLIARTILGL
jgi:hypothetical protein